MPGFYLACASSDPTVNVGGFAAYKSTDGGKRWTLLATFQGSATLGTVELIDGDEVVVELHDERHELESVPASELAWGHNRFALGGEILSAARCELVDVGTYRLAGIPDPSPLRYVDRGARFVHLDGPGIHFVPIGERYVEAEWHLKVVAHGGELDLAMGYRITPEAVCWERHR